MINKIIKWPYCTILWHVEDMKFLHANSDVFYGIISDIDAEYRKFSRMTIARGKFYKYLMMTINYSFPGNFKLSMVEHVVKMLENVPEDMKG